jgi:hypothetical protein
MFDILFADRKRKSDLFYSKISSRFNKKNVDIAIISFGIAYVRVNDICCILNFLRNM